jgi:hypothetical protein
MLGSLAIVTFFSDYSIEGKGFLMFYEVLTTSSNLALSTIIILSETPDVNLTHPGDNSNYQNNELSTFVYSPDYSHENLISVHADYAVNSLDGPCFDFVRVYKFDLVLNGTGWRNVDT